MGHLVGKDVYRKLGRKVDGLSVRAPWNDALYAILKELYTPDEAELVVRMPYGLSNVDQIERVTKIERARLQRLLDSLSEKGLLIDICIRDRYHYTISPFVVGIFEFTMMRTRGELNTKEWARLFTEYIGQDGSFFKASFGKGQMMTPLRALPHAEAFESEEYVEVLDYEKASSILDAGNKFAVGICSCRHEKMHTGEKKCDVPLETCSSIGMSADYLIRHGLAKEVSKTEMQENLDRSRELGLVFCADNVKNDISFICHCCGCCCNVIQGVSKFGYPGVLASSNYVAKSDSDSCVQCGECAEACPFNAIEGSTETDPVVDVNKCVGCGVCALGCATEAMRLTPRERRIFHPEDTFERLILQHLEQGNLQNLMFNNPQSVGHKFMRGFVGGFLKLPPVKRALAGDRLRSRFLGTLRKGR